MMTPAQQTYLDILRVVAAQMVLVGHILSLTIWTHSTTGLGDLGVIVFFILSGFLIAYTARIKQARGGHSFSAYLVDRFARIFVPFVPALLLVVVLDWAVLQWTDRTDYAEYFTLRNFIANLLMLQQHPFGFVAEVGGLPDWKLATFGSARPFWTVANEWWLYLCFGMLLFAGVWARPVVALVVFLVFAIVPLFNMAAGTGQGLSLIWAMLAIAALWYHAHRDRAAGFARAVQATGARRCLVWLGLLTTLALLLVRFAWVSFIEPGFRFDRPEFYDFNFYILLAVLLAGLYVVLEARTGGVRNRIWRFLAEYSYSLYLVHYSVIFCLDAFGLLPGDMMLRFVFLFVVANGVAIVMWAAFERHHKRVNGWIAARLGGQG